MMLPLVVATFSPRPNLKFSLVWTNYPFDIYFFNVSKNPPTYSRCNLCKFTSNYNDKKPNSTPKDLILLVSLGKMKNLIAFIRSLRTTGSKCRVIVFADISALTNYEKKFYEEAENCGIEFINIGMVKLGNENGMYYLKYCLIRDFLILNRDKFDRIIACDMFDSIVQHDPFISAFNESQVYFSNEGFHIIENKFNMDYLNDAIKSMKQIDPNFTMNYKNGEYDVLIDKWIVNGGLQAAGDADSMIAFCEEMIKTGNFNLLEAYAMDQGFINLLLHTRMFEGKFKYKVESHRSDIFSTMGYWLYIVDYDKKPEKIEFGKISRSNYYPGIIHQFDRSTKIVKAFLDVCPNDRNYPDYIRYDRN